MIRLELNQQHCDYYTELDAVELQGYRHQPKQWCADNKSALEGVKTLSDEAGKWVLSCVKQEKTRRGDKKKSVL